MSIGLGDESRRIFDQLGAISLVDVILPTRTAWPFAGVVFAAQPNIRRFCWTRWGLTCRVRWKNERDVVKTFGLGGVKNAVFTP